jgi:two-component system phosphate regulon sensor histidine kinase PhoR
MAAIAWGLLGLGLGLTVHLWWQRGLRREIAYLLRRMGFPGFVPHQRITIGQSLQQAFDTLRQREAQQAAAIAQLQDFHHLLQLLPMGYLMVDRNNIVLECNEVTRQLLGIPQWQPRTRLLMEWVRFYELDRLIEATRVNGNQLDRQTPTIRSQDWLFYPPGGESKPLPLRGWAIPLAEGRVGVFLADRRETVNLAQQRDRWASDVAHELKTPLTSIRLVAETLQPRIDPTLRTWIDRLLGETIRLSTLVQDLLELSRLDLESASALTVSRFDLAAQLQAAWQTLEPLAKQRRQQLLYEGPAEVWLWGDRSRMYRLLLNLLDNAIQYNRPDASIRVQIAQSDSQLHLDIFDSGPGFPPDDLGLVFQRFYRANAARSRSEGGTGLGLAIVRQIVDVHGGRIVAANHPETGGAWLHIELHPDQLRALSTHSVGDPR